MSDQKIIDIGTVGLFRLAAPFDTALAPQIPYTCKGVRKLSEIIADGNDPFEKYYLPYAITEQLYKDDLTEDVSIISLSSSEGQWVYVPANRILSFPEASGVVYKAIVLGVSLSALADSVNLSALKTSISNLVQDSIGVTSVIKEVVVSPPVLISYEDNEVLETARQAVIVLRRSDKSLLTESQTKLSEALTRIGILEAYIAANYVP